MHRVDNNLLGEQQYTRKSKEKSAELLRNYIDYLKEQNFYGQLIISWEHGMPVAVKNNSTLRMIDIEKLLRKK